MGRCLPAKARFLAFLLVASVACFQPCASAAWTIKDAYHFPPSPDHEQVTTFHASVSFVNDTAGVNGSAENGTGTNGTGTNGTGTNGTGTNGTGTNGTGTNGTGTNGTGTNGTGTNGTGTNGTGIDQTINVTSCQLVIEPQDNRSVASLARLEMTREAATNDFRLSLGPWPPGTEVLYHYEANLSNGTVIRSNSLWVRTPDLLGMKWHYSLSESLQLAQDLGRPLMVLVYSGYAPTTRRLDENLSRPGIIALSAGFVCCRIDNELSRDFSLEHNLTRLPVLVFVNATTGNETARLENPFDQQRVEKQMRYILGEGPRPPTDPADVPRYRAEAIALGAVLVAGPVAMYALLRFGKRRKL